MKAFGQVLSEIMKMRGLTQKELAEKSGVYQSYISKLLTGHVSDPTFSKAREIIHACGVTYEDFLSLCDEENERSLNEITDASTLQPNAEETTAISKRKSNTLLELDSGLRRMVGAWLLGRGNTKQKLAEYLNISTQTLNNRLDGSFDWQWKEIQLLADLFECSTDDLR